MELRNLDQSFRAVVVSLFLLLLIQMSAGAQTVRRAVTGTVSDEKGETLPGVSVVVKGTTRGTTTDVNGAFMLQVPAQNAMLVVSYVGFVSQEISIGNQSVITAKLQNDDKSLDEVVVVGYGIQKKVNLTGAVSTVDAKFLSNRPLTNATQALQGVQGVYVNQPTVQPGGDGATIRIRGLGTLGNNDPLVLVDGIAYSLRDVNPNDIATISVLKDAASAAIYGGTGRLTV